MFNADLFDKIYEDDAILVVNKYVGVVVNTSSTTTNTTIQEVVGEVVDDDTESEFALRSGIVHRIDKETSGILLIAKTKSAFDKIQNQFKARSVAKKYSALVFGKITDPILEINAPIGRDPKNRLRFAVVAEGKESSTTINLLSTHVIDGTILSLINAFPKTGRTHQIRVHMSALNHPIVGDGIYSNKSQKAFADRFFNRMMLHAGSIEFTHPVTGARVFFETPLPKEFLDVYNIESNAQEDCPKN